MSTPLRQKPREMEQIAVKKLREILRCRVNAVHRENLPRNGRIRFPRDLDLRQIIVAPEAIVMLAVSLIPLFTVTVLTVMLAPKLTFVTPLI